MDDAIATRLDDVVCCCTRVMPVPNIEKQADIWSAFFGKCQHVVHSPDELIRLRLSKVERTEELQRQSYPMRRQNLRALGEALSVHGKKLLLRCVGRGEYIGHHARTTDSGGKRGRRLELCDRSLELIVRGTEIDGKIQNRGPKVQRPKQLDCRGSALLHRRAEVDICSGKSDFGG